MSRLRLLAALGLLLLSLACPAAASAAPDPALVAKDATLIDDGLTAFSQKSSATDPQYFANGTWFSTSSTWWAYTQGGPASAAAVLWRHTGMTRTDLYAMSVAAIDKAIATHQRADGAFQGDPGDTQSAGIATNMYARDLGLAYVALEPRLDAARKAAWATALTRAADFLTATGELNWYTNGNIDLGEVELLYLAARVTGLPRFAAAYEADWTFLLTPPLPRWTGFGLQQPTTALRADGADGRGYLAEAGAGAPGFDAEYTGVQLDVASRLWALSRDPRALRIMNLEANMLLPRVDAAWQLDTSYGTRHTETSRKVAFITPALNVLAGEARPDLKDRALAQWPTIESTYRGTYRYTSVTFYKGLGNQLATTLLAAMTSDGRLAKWRPAAPAPAPAPTTTTSTAPAPTTTTSTTTAPTTTTTTAAPKPTTTATVAPAKATASAVALAAARAKAAADKNA